MCSMKKTSAADAASLKVYGVRSKSELPQGERTKASIQRGESRVVMTAKLAGTLAKVGHPLVAAGCCRLNGRFTKARHGDAKQSSRT